MRVIIALNTRYKEKTQIKLELNCSADYAIKLLSESVDTFILPWFMTKKNIKGFVFNNKFWVWPNTIASSINETALVGKIVQYKQRSYVSATAKIIPPFNLLPNKKVVNCIAVILMVSSWMLFAAGGIFALPYLTKIFGPLFMISCVYILVQFTQFIQKPELVSLEKRFCNIFENYISNNVHKYYDCYAIVIS